MATITKKVKKGRTYYYAVECKRVDGKPRIVWQKYLGTVERIVAQAERAAPAEPSETVIFEAGGVAALLGITQRLGLLQLINQHAPKRQQGPSVGHYMVLAALNRALEPTSKRQIGEWYEDTILRRLWKFPKSRFSSQRFWDHMGFLSDEQIIAIERTLLERLVRDWDLDLRSLLYDTTNFFTFIDTSNDRSTLAQRGKNKNKRHDLRQIGLALLVTHAFGVPLLHRVYPGNVPDSKQFKSLTEDLVTRYREIARSCDDVTVVFDKGNNSIEAFDTLAIKQVHFVASLKLTDFSELMDVPLTDFKPLQDRSGETAYQTQMEVWGAQRNVVIVYTESFFLQQLASITQQLVKCQKQLATLTDSLTAWRQGKAKGRKPTIQSVNRNVRNILKPQFMNTLIDFQVTESDGLPELSYSTNHQELRNLECRRLGRTVLCTDHPEWTAEQVVEAYRGLSNIENAFKEMKNVDFLRWQPAYHWTDDKLRVHAFYCVVALLLVSLAHKIVSESGENITPIALLKDLSAIKEVAVVYPQTDAGRPKDRITLSRMTARQRRIAEQLSVDQHLTSG